MARLAASLWSGQPAAAVAELVSVPALAAAVAAAPTLAHALLLDELWSGWLETAQALACDAS